MVDGFRGKDPASLAAEVENEGQEPVALPAVDCWWVVSDKETLSPESFSLLQHQLRSHVPYSSSCEVCVRARGLKQALRRNQVHANEVQLDQFRHGSLRFLTVAHSRSFAIGCLSGDNPREQIVADMSHWLSHIFWTCEPDLLVHM